MDMWEYYAHRAAVKDPLHEAIPALVGDADKGRDPPEKSSTTQVAYIVKGQR